MRRTWLFAVLAWTCIPGLALAEPTTPAPKLELKPCTTIPGLPPEARCGTYEVWENRTAKSGRKIPLRVAVIPALEPDRLPDALTFFGGGPGESNVGSGPEVLDLYGALRQRRDILLVDFRGTGGSNGLFCPEMQGSAGAQGLLDSYYPPEKVKACAERLAKTADFSQYTNDTSVDDVDEVRAALGYPQLDLYGGSGGSRTALVYLRRHPDKVRTATIAGVAPPDERGPFFMARHAQRALDGLIAECKADVACHGAFPRFRDEVAAVLQQAEKEPVAVPVIDGETGQPAEVRLTRSGVAQTLRYVLYRPLAASALPLMVHQAAQGDWKLLAETADHFASGRDFGGLADGYYLSLTCSEDVLFIRDDEIQTAVQGTFLGDFRIRKQQAACAAWPVPPADRKFLDPVVSDVPTLLFSGERDPVTPPVSAERAARTLKNSLAVVVPDGGHGYMGIEGAMECFNSLVVRFIEAGAVKGLDTSCLTRTKRPEFVLRWDPEVELPAGQLARLTGTYRERTSGIETRIETAGHRLKLLQGEYPPTILMAVSPTRFRVEGMGTSAFVDFQLTNGRATALTVPWAPAERWERKDKVDEYIQAEMQQRKIPGLSVAVLRNGEIIKAKGYGLANVELNVAATPETIYQSGSIGKQFIATLVMMLAEEGKLSLDDHISKYIPGAPALWKDITVRHLLTHTSGISSSHYQVINLRQDYTEDELVKEIAALPLDFQPGDRWIYSNAGYEVLGVLLHKATGKFHGDLLREKIFEPLGMTTARIISEADIVPNRADGYRLADGELKNQEWVSPTLNTTADGAMQATGQGRAELSPESETTFFTKIADITVTFVKDVGGAVTHLILRQSGGDTKLKKVK
jgi:pimeloyl-ACP methyl ester carboxylesterase